MKKCPYCAEEIQDDAVICRFCNREIVGKQKSVFGIAAMMGGSAGILAVIFSSSDGESKFDALMLGLLIGILSGLATSIFMWVYRAFFKRAGGKTFGIESGFPSVLAFAGMLILFVVAAEPLMPRSNIARVLPTETMQPAVQPTVYQFGQPAPTSTFFPMPTISQIIYPVPSPTLPSNLEPWRIPFMEGYSDYWMDSEDPNLNRVEAYVKSRIIHIDPPYHWENYFVHDLNKSNPFNSVADYYEGQLASRGFKRNQRYYDPKQEYGLVSFYSGSKLVYVQFFANHGSNSGDVIVSYKNPEE